MTEIQCQRCEPTDTGCLTCGGYKIVLTEASCENCGQKYWTRPGVVTTWDGKEFYSFDGLKITTYIDRKWTCAKCETKE